MHPYVCTCTLYLNMTITKSKKRSTTKQQKVQTTTVVCVLIYEGHVQVTITQKKNDQNVMVLAPTVCSVHPYVCTCTLYTSTTITKSKTQHTTKRRSCVYTCTSYFPHLVRHAFTNNTHDKKVTTPIQPECSVYPCACTRALGLPFRMVDTFTRQ